MFGTALLGYTGSTVADAAANAGLTIDIVSAPKPGHRFIVQQRRWVVEPTKAGSTPRLLDRHYEVTLTAHQGLLILSQINLQLRRLDRRLFDTF